MKQNVTPPYKTLDVTYYLSLTMPGCTFYVMRKNNRNKVTSSPAKAVFRRLCGWKVYCKIRDGQMIL